MPEIEAYDQVKEVTKGAKGTGNRKLKRGCQKKKGNLSKRRKSTKSSKGLMGGSKQPGGRQGTWVSGGGKGEGERNGDKGGGAPYQGSGVDFTGPA